MTSAPSRIAASVSSRPRMRRSRRGSDSSRSTSTTVTPAPWSDSRKRRSCSMPRCAIRSSTGSERTGLVRCPHTAAHSRFARCAHSKNPTRSVAEYTTRPSTRSTGPCYPLTSGGGACSVPGSGLKEVKSGVGRRGNRQRRHTALRMRTPIDYERNHYNRTTITPLIQVG